MRERERERASDLARFERHKMTDKAGRRQNCANLLQGVLV